MVNLFWGINTVVIRARNILICSVHSCVFYGLIRIHSCVFDPIIHVNVVVFWDFIIYHIIIIVLFINTLFI